MAVVKNLMVRAGADFSAITKQANKSKASMREMQSSISKSCAGMTAAVSGMGKVFGTLGSVISVAAIVAAGKSAKAAYDDQTEASTKLAHVMRNTMGARNDEVESVEELIGAQERLGIVTGDIQTQGAQELATYLTLSESLKTLLPVMNDMVAQQYGMAASAESAVNIATMMGKVMNGQTSALSRYGYSFTAAQEEILKYGNEAQRAATLAQVVSESVGGMNAALAATPNGRLQQVSNTLGAIQESFGQAVSSVSVLFIPAMNMVCNVLASAATLANKVAQSLANVFGSGASSAATVVSYTAAASGAMHDLTEETEAAGKAAEKSLSTFGFDTLQKLPSSPGGGASDTSAQALPISTGGSIAETLTGTEETGESIGWLEQGLTRLKETVFGLNFGPLTESLGRLKEAAAPLTEGLFSGLSWAYDNVFEPLAQWAVEDALPAFLEALAGAASLLSSALTVLQPFAGWLWAGFLQPIAAWTGGTIVTVLSGLAEALQMISSWISENQGLVQGMTVAVAGLAAAWQITSLGEFIINAGGVAAILPSVTTAIQACTVAKIADKVETAAICALYAKDWAVALAGNVVAIGKDVAAWIALRAEWVAGKAALVASTVAQAAHTAASWAGTAATTALGVAMNVLCSPITLVTLAIGALVAGIVLLAQNWDTVKVVGAAAWEGIKAAWNTAAEWFSTTIADPIKTAWSTATTNLGELGSGAWTTIQTVWNTAAEWFGTTIADPIKTAWSTATTNLGELGSSAWATIQTAWTTASVWFGITVVDPIKLAWSTATTNLGEWGSGAWTTIKTAWASASTWFTKNVTTPISNGFRNFANGIIGFFEGLVNGAINGINGIIRAFNKISFTVPDWVPAIGGKSWGFNLGAVSAVSLPRLAEGAVFEGNNPYLAIVNDQKHGVNVESPLSTIVEAMMIALRSSDFGENIEVNVKAVFDGQLSALARLLRPYFEADAKRVGNQASTAKVVI